jgi:hypothetical protein
LKKAPELLRAMFDVGYFPPTPPDGGLRLFRGSI